VIGFFLIKYLFDFGLKGIFTFFKNIFKDDKFEEAIFFIFIEILLFLYVLDFKISSLLIKLLFGILFLIILIFSFVNGFFK
jgi:hypothetical protein